MAFVDTSVGHCCTCYLCTCLVEKLANTGRRGHPLQLIRQPHVIIEEETTSTGSSCTPGHSRANVAQTQSNSSSVVDGAVNNNGMANGAGEHAYCLILHPFFFFVLLYPYCDVCSRNCLSAMYQSRTHMYCIYLTYVIIFICTIISIEYFAKLYDLVFGRKI